MDQVTNELKELTTQLNAFKPASSQNVDIAQKKLSEEFQQQLAIQSKVSEDVQQKLVAQTVRMDQLSESVNESKKTAQANAELMKTLLVGMENLGEHFKQLQADLEHWKSPAYQEAEREYEEMNQNLLQEVSLSVPAVLEPANAAIPPNVSIPPVFTAPTVAIPSSANITATIKELETMGLHAEWVQGTALQKPYPGAPIPSVDKGFNLEKQGQDQQARIPQFFNFIGANVEKTAPKSGKSDAQAVLVTEKSPEELQTGVSELLQRLHNEQKDQEKLAGESRRRFQMMMHTPKVSTGRLCNEHEDEDTDIMDLRNKSATSRQRSQPTSGETTISTKKGRGSKQKSYNNARTIF